MIPETTTQVYAIPNATAESTWFNLDTASSPPRFDMRMTVLCCPSEGDWPLLLDDCTPIHSKLIRRTDKLIVETADMRFGSTGQIPFNASRRLHLCHRAEKAVRYNDARSSEVTPASLAHLPPITSLPHQWALKELPACWNDCDSPTICVQTGDCRCVQADNCRPRRENPLLSLKQRLIEAEVPAKSHLGVLKGYGSSLKTAVSQLDWHDVLLPAAKDAMIAHPDFIKVHVADGYAGQDKIEAAGCHKLDATHCFSADNILYRAMRHLSVSAQEADLIVLPVYQHCTGAEFLLHDVMHHAGQTIPGVGNWQKPVSVVLTHDWGICIAFAW